MASSEINLGDIPLPSGYMLPNSAMTPFMPPVPQAPQFKSRSGVSESRKIHKDPPGFLQKKNFFNFIFRSTLWITTTF